MELAVKLKFRVARYFNLLTRFIIFLIIGVVFAVQSCGTY